MSPVADISAAPIAASAGAYVLLLVVWAAIALGVFVHATRTGNRYALLWGIATLVFPIASAVIYVARVWWNRGGKRHFTPR
jgi:hypothetical protein